MNHTVTTTAIATPNVANKASSTGEDELVFALSNDEPATQSTPLPQRAQMMANVVQAIANTQSSQPAPQNLHDFRPGEIGFADRLADQFGELLRFDASHQAWMVWTDTHWEKDETGFVVECMKKVATRMKEVEVPVMRAQIQNYGDHFTLRAKELDADAKRLHSKNAICAALALAQSLPQLVTKHSHYDADPLLLNCLSGTVDLRDGSLRSHNRGDLITNITRIPLAETSEGCPRWKRFLLEIMQDDVEMVSYLQRMVGYILTGSTQEQVFFLLHGTGANGKSVFLNVLHRLLGDYGKVADFTTFLDMNRGGAPRNDLAGFAGKRLVVASESAQGKQLDETVMKQFTGGDVISARMLYKDFVEFKPVGKLLLATNHKPKVQGTDYGIWRRMRLIPFLASFKDEQRDPHLEQKLMEEMPAILRWAVEGCIQWRAVGLGMPKAIEEAVKEYQSSMDTFQHFLDDICETGDNHKESSQRLYDAYKIWAQNSGMRFPMTQPVFNSTLAQRGFTPKRTSRSNVWLGLQLCANKGEQIGGDLCFD